MRASDLRELLEREPFEPFRVVMTGGKTYRVTKPRTAIPLKSQVFIALDDGERWVFCPYLHIASVVPAPNGRGRPRRRRS